MKLKIKNDDYISIALEWLEQNKALPDITVEYEFVENYPLTVVSKGKEAKITYGKRVELFRGLSLVVQYADKGDYSICQKRNFDSDGIMFDNSRNAVLKIDTAKTMLCIMALMGLDTMYLYTEDTYEIPEYPYFGYLRGRFTCEEIRVLDNYAKGFGIELIPCIQTLAHMNQALRWDCFDDNIDVADILLVDDDKTYALIDAMLKACRNSYTTDKINIGMDEAFLLGLGKYRENNGFHEKSEVFFNHLEKIVGICKKYGFKPSIWGDMPLNVAFGKDLKSIDRHEEIKKRIDSDVEIIHWSYYQTDMNIYNEKNRLCKLLCNKVGFAGGAVKWIGFVPSISRSIDRSRMALTSAYDNGIKDIFVTAWGDFGGEASPFCELPSMQFYAEFNYNPEVTEEYLAERFNACTGENFFDFLKLEKPNFPGKEYNTDCITTTKYLLYNDLLCGLFDLQIGENYPERYKEFYEELSAVKSKRYGYVFDTIAQISKVLSLKCDVSLKLRKAYCDCDKKQVAELVSVIKDIITEVSKLHEYVRIQWHNDNKNFGYEVQDIRFGALSARLNSAVMVLEDWITGKISDIPELAEERLPYYSAKEDQNGMLEVNENLWEQIVSPGLMR